jgi:FHA domain
MSREHAVLKADPDTRVCQASSLHLARADFPQSVFIEDVGSMHGTYVGDRRIRSHERHPLHYDNLVKFGNEVTRGPGTYPENDEAAPLCCQPTPYQSFERQALSEECCLTVYHYQSRFLHFMLLCGILGLTIGIEPCCFTLLEQRADAISHTFVSHNFGRSQSKSGAFHAEPPQNTFQVPECDDDDDDEDEEEDDDISFVQETVLKPKLEVVVPSSSCAPQDSAQSHAEDAVPDVAGQAMVHRSHSSPHPPPSSFVPIPLSRPNEGMSDLPSPLIYVPVPNSGPSGLTDAERQADKRAMNLAEKSASSETSMFTDSQSPVKSSSSLPTSPPSKEVVEKLEARVKGVVTHQTSAQPTGLKTRRIVIDEDLTQSESDADEAYSPDLMVDDSDDGQMHDGPTDYGSDSDEAALLMAENRGTKLARVEDSTDSESSHSDCSDDIGLDRDEDFFGHTASKVSNTKNSLPSGAFNDYGKESTEQEPVPYNMRPGNFTMPCTRLSLPSNPLNRAPSPSDAAMAKPCDFATSSSAVLGSSYPYNNPQPWVNPMAPTYGTAWPSHAPYDCGFQYAYDASYTTEQITSGPFRTFHSPMSMVPDQGFTSDQNGTKQPDRPTGSDGLLPPSQPQPISTTNDTNRSPTEVGGLSPDKLQSAAKVSIEGIVERLPNEHLPSHHGNQLKRKADDTTVEVLGEFEEENLEQISQADSSLASTRPPQKKAATAAQAKAVQNMASGGVVEVERPAKRARTEKKARNNNLTTLAATALAGAVVGGVGVVAALVALPPDFFV